MKLSNWFASQSAHRVAAALTASIAGSNCRYAAQTRQAIMWLVVISSLPSFAQLSTNPDKFLGNITTSYQVDYGNEKFWQLWNQITPENESKWGSIEGSRRGSFNWGSDAAYNYAKQHKFPFKFHTLIWGGQYPGWMDNLSTSEQYKAIVEWMDAVQKHYPDLQLIDVVNEAIPGHAPAPYKAALGGDGQTGYDWIIKAFEMAYERWPNAILIYNDYNTFQWQKSQFIELVRILRDAGAPVDAYGCQSHDLTDMNVSSFKSAMTEIQNALKMPMYSTEYDIGTADDAKQLQRYKEQIPYMWEADYCAGVTLWGYIYGRTWVTDGNSGIIRDGKDRPAMTWLREYMQSDKAKNAKSPFPGMVKEASLYVKPDAIYVTKGEPAKITIRARLRTKKIDHIDFYVKNKFVSRLTEAPYIAEFTPATTGKYDLKAVLVATDSTRWERLGSVTAFNPRAPYKDAIAIPGTLQAENFDSGADGIAFHDSDSKNEGGTSYRNNGGGVDIVKGGTNYAIGYTSAGEWLEYTVDVKEAGLYSFDAYVSSDNSNGAFSITQITDGGQTTLVAPSTISTTGSYDTYKAVHGRLTLTEGVQRLRLNIDNGGFNIDRIIFKRVEVDETIKLSIKVEPATVTVGETATISATASSDNATITSVRFYVNNVITKTVTKEPFEATYKPTAKGTYQITVIALDAEGHQSKIASSKLTVSPKRTAYKQVSLPGILEAENFDRGEEGFTFHDSDATDEGKANYRSDNEGVDIVKGGSGYVIGYTAVNEWLEYSVNFTETGKYACEATVSSGTTGGSFTINLMKDGKATQLCRINVPQTANNSWDTYRVVKANISRTIDAGPQVLRFSITGANCNIDKVEFKCTQNTSRSVAFTLDIIPPTGFFFSSHINRIQKKWSTKYSDQKMLQMQICMHIPA